jgi:hypothetical protein
VPELTTAVQDGALRIPEAVDQATALELRKSFARALGFDPNNVTRIEFTVHEIRVWTYDKPTRRTDELIMDTRGKATTPWKINRSTAYGHGDRLVRGPQTNG